MRRITKWLLAAIVALALLLPAAGTASAVPIDGGVFGHGLARVK
jgi:hypothetical protein